MKIIILGHRGMLGQMVKAYFAARHEVVVIDDRVDFTAQCPALASVAKAGPGLVLNCIGRIKQKTASRQDLHDANALLPLMLAERMAPGQFLVHPSTDCVFAGDAASPYRWDDPCDATDDYGWSKRLGEVALLGRANATVFRVSIIGPDHVATPPKGLLGWFLSQPEGASLRGYTNHRWNGITTLEWCRQVESVIINNPAHSWAGRVVQIGLAQGVSKYDMLRLFQEAYGTRYMIEPFATPQAVNRCLVPHIVAPDLQEQLAALRAFELAHPALRGGHGDGQSGGRT